MDLTDQLVIPIFICHQYLFLWKHSCLNLVELLHWHGPWSLMVGVAVGVAVGLAWSWELDGWPVNSASTRLDLDVLV